MGPDEVDSMPWSSSRLLSGHESTAMGWKIWVVATWLTMSVLPVKDIIRRRGFQKPRLFNIFLYICPILFDVVAVIS